MSALSWTLDLLSPCLWTWVRIQLCVGCTTVRAPVHTSFRHDLVNGWSKTNENQVTFVCATDFASSEDRHADKWGKIKWTGVDGLWACQDKHRFAGRQSSEIDKPTIKWLSGFFRKPIHYTVKQLWEGSGSCSDLWRRRWNDHADFAILTHSQIRPGVYGCHSILSGKVIQNQLLSLYRPHLANMIPQYAKFRGNITRTQLETFKVCQVFNEWLAPTTTEPNTNE